MVCLDTDDAPSGNKIREAYVGKDLGKIWAMEKQGLNELWQDAATTTTTALKVGWPSSCWIAIGDLSTFLDPGQSSQLEV